MSSKRQEFVVVVPQKHLRGAKSRLSSVLSADARREFILAMLRRTLGICRQLPGKSGFFLCGPEDLAEVAQEFGAALVPAGDAGMRRDIADVACDTRVHGHAALLVVSSDLPLLQLADLEEVVQAWRDCADVVLCPDLRRRGTNVMMVNEPEAFPYCFGDVVGPGSFQLHKAQAQGTGLTVTIIENERLSLDIDLPSDLARFISTAPDHPIAKWAKARFHEAFRFE